jgi:hypothetical protein
MPYVVSEARKPKRKPKGKVYKPDIAFEYYEFTRSCLRDLLHIDGLIPRETSRYSRAAMESEASAIIEARKRDLFRYIQTICRDHMYWGSRLLAKGWTPEQRKRKVKLDSTGREWLRRNTVG